MGDTYNFNDKTQFIKEAKDYVTITQNNFAENKENQQKFDSIISGFESKLNETVARLEENKASYEETIANLNKQSETTLSQIIGLIQIGFNELDAEEQRRFEELKQKPDWETTLTFIVPVIDKLGVKIESKTKLEKLPAKFRDQIKLAQEKYAELTGKQIDQNNLETSKVKGELSK